jgi:hypothetical protein
MTTQKVRCQITEERITAMYNDNQIPVRDEPHIPRVDEQIGGRLCDGTAIGGQNAPSHGFGLHNYPLAMVYSPYQHFKELYSLDKALEEERFLPSLICPLKEDTGRYARDEQNDESSSLFRRKLYDDAKWSKMRIESSEQTKMRTVPKRKRAFTQAFGNRFCHL